MKRHLVPLWTVQDRYHWNQRFPAGRDVAIAHRYVPGVGGSVETPVSFKQFRNSADSRRAIRRYCMDAAFLAAIDARASSGRRMPAMIDPRGMRHAKLAEHLRRQMQDGESLMVARGVQLGPVVHRAMLSRDWTRWPLHFAAQHG